MFEQTLEGMVAYIYVDDQSAGVCSQNGLPLERGWRELTFLGAVALIKQGEGLYPSVPKYQQQRFRSTLNGIRSAFGPEFMRRFPDTTALEGKAFIQKTRWA